DAGLAGTLFRNCEDDKEKNGKSASGNGGDGFSEEVDDGDSKENQSDEREADGNLDAANGEVKGDLKIAFAGAGVTKDENGEAVHGERPDDAESVKVCEKIDVAAADEDGRKLKQNNNVDDAIAGAEAWVGLAEPGGEDAVFGDAIEDAVRT